MVGGGGVADRSQQRRIGHLRKVEARAEDRSTTRHHEGVHFWIGREITEGLLNCREQLQGEGIALLRAGEGKHDNSVAGISTVKDAHAIFAIELDEVVGWITCTAASL